MDRLARARCVRSAAAASGIAARSIGPFFAAAYAVGRLIACCLPLVALETISLTVCDLLPPFVGTPAKGVTGLGPEALVPPVAILKALIPIRDPSSMRGIMVPVVVAGLMTLVWIFRGFVILVRPRGARYLEFQTHPNRNLHRCSYQNLPKRYFENSVLDRKNRYQSATFRHFYLWNEIETTPLLLAAKHHF